MDLPLVDGQVDVIVGDELAEALRYPSQFELQDDLPTGAA